MKTLDQLTDEEYDRLTVDELAAYFERALRGIAQCDGGPPAVEQRQQPKTPPALPAVTSALDARFDPRWKQGFADGVAAYSSLSEDNRRAFIEQGVGAFITE